MVRLNSPDIAAPSISIELSQNPNKYFFPASNISGNVIYTNHGGSEDYDLYMKFAGYNVVTIKGSSGKGITEKATLFEYSRNLHPARKDQVTNVRDLAPGYTYFKHRFPSATDNRAFLPGNVMPNLTFSNMAHDLPATFEVKGDNFKCSVEYSLKAELYKNKKLIAEYTLPVMFLPYMRPLPGTRNSPTFFTMGDPFGDKPFRKIRKDSFVSHYAETILNMGIDLPTEITMGKPFTFNITIQLSYTPDFEFQDDFPRVDRIGLDMIATASGRTLQATAHGPFSPFEEKQVFKDHPITLHPFPVYSSPSTFDPSTNTISYECEATLPSYYRPSFRSFLVSNTFSFVGPVHVAVDGRRLEIPISMSEVTVLSCVAQAAPVRRVNTMTTGRNFAYPRA